MIMKLALKRMLEIKPNALYTRSDLAALLEPAGVNVDHFIGRLKPRKVFKMIWFGEDILAALRNAQALPERDENHTVAELPPAANRGNRKKRGSAVNDPLDRLHKLIREG